MPQLQTNFNYPPKKLNPTFLHQPPAKTTFLFFLQITENILNTNTNFFQSFKLHYPFPSLPEIFSCLNRCQNHLLTLHYFQKVRHFFAIPSTFVPRENQEGFFSTIKTIADIRIYKQTNFHYFRFLRPKMSPKIRPSIKSFLIQKPFVTEQAQNQHFLIVINPNFVQNSRQDQPSETQAFSYHWSLYSNPCFFLFFFATLRIKFVFILSLRTDNYAMCSSFLNCKPFLQYFPMVPEDELTLRQRIFFEIILLIDSFCIDDNNSPQSESIDSMVLFWHPNFLLQSPYDQLQLLQMILSKW